MDYEELKEWIQKKMTMKKNYQPIAIRTLLQNDNKATEDEIRKEISAVNSHLLPTKKNKNPFDVLINHKVIRYNESEKKYELVLDEALSIPQRDELIKICSKKIETMSKQSNRQKYILPELEEFLDKVDTKQLQVLRKFQKK